MSKKVSLDFITKPDCHLCEEARPIVVRVVETLLRDGKEVVFTEHNILEDVALASEYSEDIPVVLINGKRHSYWHVDESRLEKALRKKFGRFSF